MKGEDQPILIVDETRIDFVLYSIALAIQLRALIGNLHRLAVLIFSFIGDLPGLGLPNPRMGDVHSGELYVEGVADRVDLFERIKAIALGNRFGDGRVLLRPG